MRISVVVCLFLIVSCGSDNTAINVEVPLKVIESTKEIINSDCQEHFLFGMPISVEEEYTNICHNGYFIAFDKNKKIPRYTSHEITINDSIGYVEREPRFTFEPDPLIEEIHQANYLDYKGSLYERGHMQAWADSSLLNEALESNYYSNVVPQLPAFNRGIWFTLEHNIRRYVTFTGNDVYVFTGSLDGSKTMGNGIEIPVGFYKIIFDGNTEVMSAYMINQHDDISKPLSHYVVSVDQIEKITQLNFYPLMALTAQERLEKMNVNIFSIFE